jgi:hypothetical protein
MAREPDNTHCVTSRGQTSLQVETITGRPGVALQRAVGPPPDQDRLAGRPRMRRAPLSGLPRRRRSGARSRPIGGANADDGPGSNHCGVALERRLAKHAIRQFHLQTSTSNWLIQGSQPFSASQISGAELAASRTELSVEAKNDQPTSASVIGSATIFGIVIALGVLGMSVGLVRSEWASDLRTLAATGAPSYTRRTLTAVTAGALGFLGALLGVVGGYIGMIGWLRSNSLNGGIAALGSVPVGDLLLLLIGMPAFATAVAWLLASREPVGMAYQPIE